MLTTTIFWRCAFASTGTRARESAGAMTIAHTLRHHLLDQRHLLRRSLSLRMPFTTSV